MKWCRFHGILTPASLRTFLGPEGPHYICGYPWRGQPEELTAAACTSPVYNLETYEIDAMVEAGIPTMITGPNEPLRFAKLT